MFSQKQFFEKNPNFFNFYSRRSLHIDLHLDLALHLDLYLHLCVYFVFDFQQVEHKICFQKQFLKSKFIFEKMFF